MMSKWIRLAAAILLMLSLAEPAGAESVEARLAALESEVAGLQHALTLSQLDVPGIVSRALPGVVSIYNVTAQDQVSSKGTGWLLSTNGIVVTNAHVVDPNLVQKVKFADGSTAVAHVIMRDAFSDLAELEIPGEEYAALPIAKAKPKPGEPVVVIGNAMGFSNSISVGVISGVDRQDPTHHYHYPALQIDAPIQVGCSGGPILNSKGEVVGIASWREESAGGAIGFGIPIARLQETLNRTLPDRGTVRPWLGASVKEPYWSRNDSLPNTLGLIVSDVHPDGAAYAGGLRSRDYIQAVNQTPVNYLNELRIALEKQRPGDKVTVLISRRDGSDGLWKEQRLDVTLGESSGAIQALIPNGYDPTTDDVF